MKNAVIALVVLMVLVGLWSPANGKILFTDNYDQHNDWTIPQSGQNTSSVWPSGSNMPSSNPTSGPRYIGWYNSETYLTDGPGKNTIYIDGSNARGGKGKGVTYWCEVPDFNQPFEASDATLYISLTDTPGDYGYSEIWVQVWRMFQKDFYSDLNGHKFIHASHYGGSGYTLTNWFPTSDANASHAPAIVGGTTGYGYTDSTGNKLRVNYMLMLLRPYLNRSDYRPNSPGNLLCGALSHDSKNNTSYTLQMLQTTGTKDGGWQSPGNFGDGDWHYHEYHLKMNSSPGVADGIYEYYIDGVCQASHRNVPWVVSGDMVGWNMVALGGNEDFQGTVAGGYEVYYAWDDLTISTHRISVAPGIRKIQVQEQNGEHSVHPGQ